MTKQEMTTLVQNQLTAYNSRNLEAFCVCFHPEIKISYLISDLTTQDLQQFREGYKKLFESNPNLHCELKSRIVLDTAVIDEEYVTGSSRFPEGLHTTAIYAFRDGRIDRVWFAR